MLMVIIKSIWFITIATGFAPVFAIAIAIMLLTDKLGITNFQE